MWGSFTEFEYFSQFEESTNKKQYERLPPPEKGFLKQELIKLGRVGTCLKKWKNKIKTIFSEHRSFSPVFASVHQQFKRQVNLIKTLHSTPTSPTPTPTSTPTSAPAWGQFHQIIQSNARNYSSKKNSKNFVESSRIKYLIKIKCKQLFL